MCISQKESGRNRVLLTRCACYLWVFTIRKGGNKMASIDGIERRTAKLEQGNKLPPVIVWHGQEDKVTLLPGQKLMVIRWMDEKKNDRG